MILNPKVMSAVERLDYRVTPGDVATQAGIDVTVAQQGLLALATEAGGHLQVSDMGEVAYVFPRQFRTILQSKSFRLRLQQAWQRVWNVLFYIIRISFGVMLIASIVLIMLAIIAILIAMSSAGRSDDRGGGINLGGGRRGGGGLFWFSPNWFYIFSPGYGRRRRYAYGGASRPMGSTTRGAAPKEDEMGFLEAVFSFLFGDGDPNADLEERRWQAIATVIRNQGGAIAAEQVAPYLDVPSNPSDDEDYMLPVLLRFNGSPEVSDDGQLIYRFPELQVTAKQAKASPVAAYLKETVWKFSNASSSQLTMAAGLGGVNLLGAIWLGFLLRDGWAAALGGLVGVAGGLYGVLIAYALGFVAIPLLRYLWIQRQNQKLEARNTARQDQALRLNEANSALQKKLSFARQFAAETVVKEDDLAYTSERDLTEQELAQKDKTDQDWYRRLEGF